MYGYEVLSGLEGGHASWLQGEGLITANPTTRVQCQNTVEIDVGILIVVQPTLEVAEVPRGELNFTSEPDFARIPLRANFGPRSFCGAKSALPLFPC